MSAARAVRVAACAPARVATNRYHHRKHARCGAPRNAPSLFYPLRYPPHVRCVFPARRARRSDRRAAEDRASSAPSPPSSAPSEGERAAHDLYDPEALLAHPCGFLVTAFPRAGVDGRSRAKKAVAEARYLLESARDAPRTLGGAVEDLLLYAGETETGTETAKTGKEVVFLPLHPRGALGSAFLPLALTDAAAATPFPAGHPLSALGVAALETFAADPPPPRGTPEFLSRLLPVQRTCRATERDITETVAGLLPQSGLGGFVAPPGGSKASLDPFASPMTFSVKYEHHGKASVDRERLVRSIEALVLTSPDYLVDDDDPRRAIVVHVYHDVALCSVVPDWRRNRGFSPRGVAEARARAAGEAEPVSTTGGEGYP